MSQSSNYAAIVSYLVLLIALMWSTEIGPEQPMPIELPPENHNVAPESAKPATPPPTIKGSSRPRDQIPVDPWATIDRQSFLRAFKRQAAMALTPCLNEWLASPQWLTVAATLTRSGQLKNPISLDQRQPLPACAIEAIEAMNFSAIGDSMRRDSVTLQWRIDW